MLKFDLFSSSVALNRTPMAFRWQADDGLLIVVFGSFLPSLAKKTRSQSWTPSDKTFWIPACLGYFAQENILSTGTLKFDLCSNMTLKIRTRSPKLYQALIMPQCNICANLVPIRPLVHIQYTLYLEPWKKQQKAAINCPPNNSNIRSNH